MAHAAGKARRCGAADCGVRCCGELSRAALGASARSEDSAEWNVFTHFWEEHNARIECTVRGVRMCPRMWWPRTTGWPTDKAALPRGPSYVRPAVPPPAACVVVYYWSSPPPHATTRHPPRPPPAPVGGRLTFPAAPVNCQPSTCSTHNNSSLRLRNRGGAVVGGGGGARGGREGEEGGWIEGGERWRARRGGAAGEGREEGDGGEGGERGGAASAAGRQPGVVARGPPGEGGGISHRHAACELGERLQPAHARHLLAHKQRRLRACGQRGCVFSAPSCPQTASPACVVWAAGGCVFSAPSCAQKGRLRAWAGCVVSVPSCPQTASPACGGVARVRA